MRKRLRQALWSDKSLDIQSRGIREIFATIPDVEIRPFVGLYQTGLTLKVEDKPVAIELIRCRIPATPETPVAHGNAVSFDLKPQGALITRIDGLTPGAATIYEFTFRITYGDA